jgi:hypothetical protein
MEANLETQNEKVKYLCIIVINDNKCTYTKHLE